MDITANLSSEFSIRPWQAENVVALIDEGCTIPFIARYRKEKTGSLDDQLLRQISDRLAYLRNLDAHRAKIKELIRTHAELTEEISSLLDKAETITEIDDIYRPFRPKRKTRASIAREKGLGPMAEEIYSQGPDLQGPEEIAEKHIKDLTEAIPVQDALCGASDIIAEKISDDAELRKRLRYVCMMNAAISSEGTKEDMGVYEMYSNFYQPLSKLAGHSILAINRAEKEEFIKVNVVFDRAKALNIVYALHVKPGSSCTDFVKAAAEDAYDRLIFPALEREIRGILTEKASNDAISLFGTNLRQLLMQPPVRDKVTIGFDPGYRTGCKVAVIDQTGKVLDTTVIYPAPPHKKTEEAKRTVKELVKKYNAEIFAIGNGTASHETTLFAAEVIKELDVRVSYIVVSEAGASVYSASKAAALEFPEYDVSLRSAVSIARRLQDPLAELVKIDPKSIGIGQYQHDMPQNRLSEVLDGVVEECVNKVGADLNTASAQLLEHVAGINASIAKNIVDFREKNGAFTSRAQLKKVSKLGPKAFEQCAGFLRIDDGENVLDRTSVHPESYEAAEKLLTLVGYGDEDVKLGKTSDIETKIKDIGIETAAEKIGTGIPTLMDIAEELSRPHRDPRDSLPAPMLRTDIAGIEDLKAGMQLTGTVRNITDFGAFVDIGVHQDGLVHISQISKKRISHPSDILKVGDIVNVWVLQTDLKRNRISLTMKQPDQDMRQTEQDLNA